MHERTGVLVMLDGEMWGFGVELNNSDPMMALYIRSCAELIPSLTLSPMGQYCVAAP